MKANFFENYHRGETFNLDHVEFVKKDVNFQDNQITIYFVSGKHLKYEGDDATTFLVAWDRYVSR